MKKLKASMMLYGKQDIALLIIFPLITIFGDVFIGSSKIITKYLAHLRI